MKWGSFIFGLLLLILALSDTVAFIILILPALLLLANGVGESEPEKTQKQQLQETIKLREEVKSLKNTDLLQKQSEEIESLKKQLNELKRYKRR